MEILDSGREFVVAAEMVLWWREGRRGVMFAVSRVTVMSPSSKSGSGSASD